VASSKQYERFFKLLYSLMGFVMSNARPIEWLTDHFQRMVNEPNPVNTKIPIQGRSEEEVRELILEWHRWYPQGDVSARVVNLLREFYSDTPVAPLGQQFASERGFRAWVQEALFWLDIDAYVLATPDTIRLGGKLPSATRLPRFACNSVEIVRSVFGWEMTSFGNWRRPHDEFHVYSHGDPKVWKQAPLYLNLFGGTFNRRFYRGFGGGIKLGGHGTTEGVDGVLKREIFPQLVAYDEEHDSNSWTWLRGTVIRDLESAIVYTVWHEYCYEKGAKFSRLLELYRAGLYPLGLTNSNHVVILASR